MPDHLAPLSAIMLPPLQIITYGSQQWVQRVPGNQGQDGKYRLLKVNDRFRSPESLWIGCCGNIVTVMVKKFDHKF